MTQLTPSISTNGTYKATFECPECGITKEYKTSYGKSITSCSKCMTSPHTNKNYKQRLYDVWYQMKNRCQNPDNKKYNIYGGKGVKVFEAWLEFKKFHDDNIVAYERAKILYNNKTISIDRIDPEGNYEPSNTRWISLSENSGLAGDKLIRQYDQNTGTFIAEYKSATQASEALGIKNTQQIMRAARGERRISNGFIWKYVKDITPEWTPGLASNNPSRNNSYRQYNIDREIIKEYFSLDEALQDHQGSRSTITKCCRGVHKNGVFKNSYWSSSAYNHEIQYT